MFCVKCGIQILDETNAFCTRCGTPVGQPQSPAAPIQAPPTYAAAAPPPAPASTTPPAERGGNIDVALNLAQKAKEQVPDDPHISDTLGWIYYKKNVPGRAVAYLKEAAEKLPNQALVRYHLGMAYHKNGNRDLAKKELAEALKIDPKFQGADEARATLNALK